MAKYISDEALAVLRRMFISGNEAFFNDLDAELERNLYQEVNEVISRILGKWNGRKKCHIFPFDPTPALHSMLETRLFPDKNPTAYFPTPKPAVDALFSCIEEYRAVFEGKDMNILEPSAGQGALATEARKRFPLAKIDTVEFLDINQHILKEKGFFPFCGSFLDYNIDATEKYDLIIMNPPFSAEGDPVAYITHIMHAYDMLKEDGQLLAIAPIGWTTAENAKQSAFREWVYMGGEMEMLPSSSFKESKTNVETCVITKDKNPWKIRPYMGLDNYYLWEFQMAALNSYDIKKELISKDPEQLVLNIFKDYKKIEFNFPLSLKEQYLSIISSINKEDPCESKELIFGKQKEAEQNKDNQDSIFIPEDPQDEREIQLGGLFAFGR